MSPPDVGRLIRPASIAVVGATEGGGPGMVLTKNLLQAEGVDLQLVNPRRPEIFGRPTIGSLAAAEADVDVVAIALGAANSLPVIEEAVRLGMQRLVVVADGFDDPDLRMTTGQSLRQYAVQHDLTLCGPNGLGFMNFVDGVFPSIQGAQEYVEHSGRGNVALLSQSGGMMLGTLASSGDRAVGYSYVVSTGSEFSLGVEDYINWLIEDDHTQVIALLLEGLRDGPRFVDAATRAIASGKPVVSFKLGRTASGQSAVAAHTGKVAGDARIFDAVFEQLGVVACADIGEFVETLVAFSGTRGRSITGNRIAATMISGGAATYIADLADDSSLQMPEIPSGAAERLIEQLSTDANLGNPLDISGGKSVMDPDGVVSVIDTLSRSGAYDCIAFVVPMKHWGGVPHIKAFNRALFAYSGRSELPMFILAVNPDALNGYWSGVITETGALVLQDLPRAFTALARVLNWPDVQARAARRSVSTVTDGSQRSRSAPPAVGSRRTLSSQEARALFEGYGIPLIPERTVTTADETVAAAEEFGYPVVLKVETPDVPHKTEAGLVVLNLERPKAVLLEAERLLAEMAVHRWPDAALVVQGMMEVEAEFLLGMVRDPTFGPVVVFGVGGTLVELIPNGTVVVFSPEDPSDLDVLEGHSVLARLLGGYRGRAGLTKDVAFGLIRALHDIAVAHPDVLSIDINPLAVDARSGVIAGLDLLVEVIDEAGPPTSTVV